MLGFFLLALVVGQVDFSLGKTSIEKKTFSFGHCPNDIEDMYFGLETY